MANPTPQPQLTTTPTQTDTGVKLTAEEQKVIADAQQSTQSLLNRVGHGGVQARPLADYVAAIEANNTAGVNIMMASSPKAFTLTLDGPMREQIAIPKGVIRLPDDLLAHWYMKANGVKAYEGAGNIAPPRTVPILSSSAFAGDPGIDAAIINDITVAAYTLSGMDAEKWNQLTDAQRADMMRGVYEHRKRMAADLASKSSPPAS